MKKIVFTILLCGLLIFSCGTTAAAEEAWIAIDPTPDTAIGDTLILSGTTNAVPGTQLDIVVRPATLQVTSDYPAAFSGKATVIKGTAGISFWSVANDTAKMLADKYEVRVSDAVSGSSVTTYFNLCKEPVSPSPSKEYQITLNPVVYPASGDSYLFSGTTSAPAGSVVLVDVGKIASTITGDSDHVFSLPLVYETSGVVTAGEHGINHWAIQSSLTPYRLAEPNVRYAAAAFLPEMPKTVSATRTISGSGSWTTVDAVADAATGDVITLSGTTNLPPGERITVEVYNVIPGPSPKKPDQPVFSKEILIESGSVWSAELDTEGIRMGTYTVVAADAPYFSGPVFSLALPKDRQWIAMDPIPFVTQNSSFTLSGTTGLDDGMQLLIEVLPRYFIDEVLAHDSKACYSLISGTSMTTVIVPGENNVNIWSVPIDTRSWTAETYVVKVVGIEVDVTAPRTEFELYPEHYVPPANTEPPKETEAPGFAFVATLIAAVAAVMFTRK